MHKVQAHCPHSDTLCLWGSGCAIGYCQRKANAEQKILHEIHKPQEKEYLQGHKDLEEPSSIQSTLAERGTRYGDFTRHAIYADRFQSQMEDTDNWNKLLPYQRQALRVIADKIARILNGDPNYDDNWRDIAGYATLVLERLPK